MRSCIIAAKKYLSTVGALRGPLAGFVEYRILRVLDRTSVLLPKDGVVIKEEEDEDDSDDEAFTTVEQPPDQPMQASSSVPDAPFRRVEKVRLLAVPEAPLPILTGFEQGNPTIKLTRQFIAAGSNLQTHLTPPSSHVQSVNTRLHPFNKNQKNAAM